jgi:hypothetical protein
MSGKVIKIKPEIENGIVSDSGGEPPMDSYLGQYLDARFASIESDVKEIRSEIKEIRSDIKDQSKRIDGLKYWILGGLSGLGHPFLYSGGILHLDHAKPVQLSSIKYPNPDASLLRIRQGRNQTPGTSDSNSTKGEINFP